MLPLLETLLICLQVSELFGYRPKRCFLRLYCPHCSRHVRSSCLSGKFYAQKGVSLRSTLIFKTRVFFFQCEGSCSPLCKTIEAACKLRYQVCQVLLLYSSVLSHLRCQFNIWVRGEYPSTES